MCTEEWSDRSCLIEMKPRAEFAALFVDCPPTCISSSPTDSATSVDQDTNEGVDSEVVNINKRSIMLREFECDRGEEGKKIEKLTYAMKFGDITLMPNTVCSLTWADNHRLFMCKVRSEVAGCPLVWKTYHRLAVDVSSSMLLDEYVENAKSKAVTLQCAECKQTFIERNDGKLNLCALPEDGWLDTSPALDYFCTCDHSSTSQSKHASDEDLAAAKRKWTPTEQRICIADSCVLVLRNLVPANSMMINEFNVIRCAKCMNELGTVSSKSPSILQFHHSTADLYATGDNENYISARFGSLERFFAWLLLYQCDSQTSMKLVFRSYDKRPYLLVWLLESYVVICRGKLVRLDAESNDGAFYSFPALKMLYKVFDTESAKTDPRANGEDASVGLVDLPMACCVQLSHALISSTLSLPPAGRCIGQFYVGCLKLKNFLS